jgi:hypothetical protein
MLFQDTISLPEKTMKMRVLIEATSIMVFSFVAMAEGLRLIVHKDPHVLYDPLGPGFYIFALSVGLMTVGVFHFIVNYRKSTRPQKVPVSKDMRRQMFSSVMVLAIYIFLIDFAGYLLATLIFNFVELRIAGVKSWGANSILTLILTIAYYVIFVKYCGIAFPKGIFLPVGFSL